MSAHAASRPALDPCQYGLSGHCLAGRHDPCHGGPVVLPGGYLTDPSGAVVLDHGRAVEVGPRHVWRCPCWCHARVRWEAAP